MHPLGLTQGTIQLTPDLVQASYFQHPKHHLCMVRRLGGFVPRPVEHQIHRHRKSASKGQSDRWKMWKFMAFAWALWWTWWTQGTWISRAQPKQQPNDFWVKHWLQEIWLMQTNARQTTLFASENPSIHTTFNLAPCCMYRVSLYRSTSLKCGLLFSADRNAI